MRAKFTVFLLQAIATHKLNNKNKNIGPATEQSDWLSLVIGPLPA